MKDADPLTPDHVIPVDSLALATTVFGREQVTELRHAVARLAGAAGLTGQRLEDFVLAANELITNVVRHGGGQGRLRLWWAEAALHCEVSDTGLGIDPNRLHDHSRPPADSAGGWGLWLVRRLSDAMTVESGPAGTTVRISTTVPALAVAAAGGAEPIPPEPDGSALTGTESDGG